MVLAVIIGLAVKSAFDEARAEVRAWMQYGWEIVTLARNCCPDVTIPPPPFHEKYRAAPIYTKREALTPELRGELRQIFQDRLSKDEIINALFDMGSTEDYEHLSKSALDRQLVDFIDERHQYKFFVRRMHVSRPDIEFPS